jgi:hypothetical protein
MKENILFILVGLIIISCSQTVEKNNYKNDLTISDKEGKPNDSLTYYYPFYIKYDTLLTSTGRDSSSVDYYSCILYYAKEPVLYNFYQDHDIYRFLWLRSFHRPIVYALSKIKNQVLLTAKIMDKHPRLRDITYVSIPELRGSQKDEMQVDSVVKADRRIAILSTSTKQLTKKEWKEFEQLLDSCSFWTTKPFERTQGIDGARWIIEGHKKNKYWFVDRWSPKDNFRKAGEYLIIKSGLNERIY